MPWILGQSVLDYMCCKSLKGACFFSCVCPVPGCGEHLIRTMLARECSAAMQSEDAHQALLEAMQNKFISESPARCPITAAFPYARICQPRALFFCEKHIERIKQTDVA